MIELVQSSISHLDKLPYSCPISGFYRGISPGVTGSLATGATYFGVIESTKTWLENANPNLSGHWSHFIAGGIGEKLFSYIVCI